MKLGILVVSEPVWDFPVLKGLWKLTVEAAPASPDCSRRCDGIEAVTEVAGAAARRVGVVELGRVCRVQLRRATPAEGGTGRMMVVVRGEEVVVYEIGAWNKLVLEVLDALIASSGRAKTRSFAFRLIGGALD